MEEVTSTEEKMYFTPEQYQEIYDLNVQQHEELLLQDTEQHQQILEALSNLNVNISGVEAELSIDDNGIIEKLDSINTMLESTFSFVDVASSAITTYAVFYVPLIILVLALWWFFKQFIR